MFCSVCLFGVLRRAEFVDDCHHLSDWCCSLRDLTRHVRVVGPSRERYALELVLDFHAGSHVRSVLAHSVAANLLFYGSVNFQVVYQVTAERLIVWLYNMVFTLSLRQTFLVWSPRLALVQFATTQLPLALYWAVSQKPSASGHAAYEIDKGFLSCVGDVHRLRLTIRFRTIGVQADPFS